MNDEDLNPYSGKLVSTPVLLSDAFITTTPNTTPNGSGYAITSTPGTGLITSVGAVSVSPSYPAGYGNITTNWKLSPDGTHDVVNQTKEQQLEDVKDILNSVQRALDGLKTQVQVLSASIEDENKLKHKRRKLGGDE